MKKTCIVLLGTAFLFAGMTSCKKDSVDPKTPEELNEEAKAALAGKWELDGFQINGLKEGQLVTENIDDEGILAYYTEELPAFVEVTQTHFTLVDPDSEEQPGRLYTLDAATGTIVIADDGEGDDQPFTQLKYSMTGTDLLHFTLLDEGIESDLYDSFEIKLNLKRISAFPTPE